MIDPERDSWTKRLWVNNFSVKHEYGSDPYYEIDVTPYDLMPRQTLTWNTSPDARVRTNYEKLNKACEEINRNLTKSILDEYDLSYIDTDMAATMAATKEAFKNYILEGKKMPIKTGYDYELKGFTFVPVYKYGVKKIIHSGLWTIVTWEDGSITKVKMEDDGHYDEYAAFTAALAKKVYGNNSKVHKILETKTVEQKAKKKEKHKEPMMFESTVDKLVDALSKINEKGREANAKC